MRLEGCARAYRRGAETVHALVDASLSLHPGELVALVGPSGSGKTTLLNVLVGWETPDRGEVVWPGRPGPPGDRDWGELGIVPQRLGLVEELTVGENVALPLRLARGHGSDAGGHLDALVDALGLRGLTGRLPDEVSLGEQQRAAIARALVRYPALVVLDEPTGHQDEASAARVMDVLLGARDRGTCCLLATHAEDALARADRVVAIRDGRLHGS